MKRIYIADVGGIEEDGRFTAMCRELPLYRQKKIASLKFFRDRRLSMQAGTMQNKALRDYLECCGLPVPDRISDIPVHFNQFGKPYYPDFTDFHFNISHSGTKVLCVSSDRECGCDVEEIKAVRPEVARRIMTDDEYVFYERSEKPDEFFCRVWTLKESVLKTIGTGLNTPMEGIRVMESDGNACRSISFEGRRYCPEIIGGADGYCCAVCLESEMLS